jgi:uncharacterized protein YicC (UPF0701 family)
MLVSISTPFRQQISIYFERGNFQTTINEKESEKTMENYNVNVSGLREPYDDTRWWIANAKIFEQQTNQEISSQHNVDPDFVRKMRYCLTVAGYVDERPAGHA